MRALRKLFAAGILALAAASSHAVDFAVTPQGFDDLDALLTAMGLTHDQIAETALTDYNTLKNYKTVFINCSASIQGNAATDAGAAALRQFVSEGGTVYASDWASAVIDKAWPGMITFTGKVGDVQLAPATVVNEGMRDYIGASSVDLDFNLGGWVPITTYNKSKKAQAYLVGAGGDDSVNGKAIMVLFPYGKGSVIYTAFHNEAGLGVGPQAQKVLEYMVFIAILTSTANDLARTLRDQGYLVTKENLGMLSVSGVSSSIAVSDTDSSDYAVGVAWLPTANFILDVTPPAGGPQQIQAGASPMILTYNAASVGTWGYALTLFSSSDARHPYVVMAAHRVPAYPSLQVKTYPNPFKATDNDVFVFDGLPARAVIRIFNLQGTLVKTISKDDTTGTAFWYVDNQDGEKLSSGLYLYVVEGDGAVARGKLVILK